MSPDEYEAYWNGQTSIQEHILSQADALTKNVVAKEIPSYETSRILYRLQSFTGGQDWSRLVELGQNRSKLG